VDLIFVAIVQEGDCAAQTMIPRHQIPTIRMDTLVAGVVQIGMIDRFTRHRRLPRTERHVERPIFLGDPMKTTALLGITYAFVHAWWKQIIREFSSDAKHEELDLQL
jgi:hypothetical protein